MHLGRERVQALRTIERDLGIAVADGIKDGFVRHRSFGCGMRGARGGAAREWMTLTTW
jgi:hypothetical protein